MESEQLAYWFISVMVNVPGTRKVFTGLIWAEVVPSPKFQEDETGGDDDAF